MESYLMILLLSILLRTSLYTVQIMLGDPYLAIIYCGLAANRLIRLIRYTGGALV